MKELLADDGWPNRRGAAAGAELVATGAATVAAAARPPNEGTDVVENRAGLWAAVEATGGVGLGAAAKGEAPLPPMPPNEKTLLALEAKENAAPAVEAGADANSEVGAALLAEGAVAADVATGMNELPTDDGWLVNDGTAAICIGLRWPSGRRGSGGRTRDGAPWTRFFMWNGDRAPHVDITRRIGIGAQDSILPMISRWALCETAIPSGYASSPFFRGTSALPWLSSSQSSHCILSVDLQPKTAASMEFLHIDTRIPHSGRW